MICLNKINRGLGCGFLLGVTLLASCQAKPEYHIDTTERYEISGLEIGQSEEELRARMDEPSKIETVFWDYPTFVYSGLTVDLQINGSYADSPKLISGIRSDSPNNCFNKTVCPGDSLDSVKAKLGDAEILPAENDKAARLYYRLPNLETCWLWVFTEDFKVSSEVYIACQP